MDDSNVFYDEQEDILYLAKEEEKAEVVELCISPQIANFIHVQKGFLPRSLIHVYL